MWKCDEQTFLKEEEMYDIIKIRNLICGLGVFGALTTGVLFSSHDAEAAPDHGTTIYFNDMKGYLGHWARGYYYKEFDHVTTVYLYRYGVTGPISFGMRKGCFRVEMDTGAHRYYPNGTTESWMYSAGVTYSVK